MAEQTSAWQSGIGDLFTIEGVTGKFKVTQCTPNEAKVFIFDSGKPLNKIIDVSSNYRHPSLTGCKF